MFHTTDDGCRIGFELSGAASAPPLVLSHALGTHRGLWDAQLEPLAQRFRVLRYDTRGHGRSDAPGGDYSIERLSRDVLSLMDHVEMSRAHVCGVSLGGLTALWLGVHAPGRVHSLVLANTAARIGTVGSWRERMRVAHAQGLGALVDATIERWFTPAFREAHPDRIARMTDRLVRTAVAGYLGCCAALRDADFQAEASRVTAPCLVVTGTRDKSTTHAAGQWLAEAIAGARLQAFDAAHLPNVECAPAFTEALLTFLP
jgi:3-oxoadipate enol-lactonase